MTQKPKVTELALYRRCIERVQSNWPAFTERRAQWLAQRDRYGVAAEKVAENILQDLFTEVLDWSISDLANQHQRADLLLTRLSVKYLLIEVKHPGALVWNKTAVQKALDQARRYASEQKVRCIAVSDAVMLYAEDTENDSRRQRVFVSLESSTPPEALWWLSLYGIYQEVEELPLPSLTLPEEPSPVAAVGTPLNASDELMHPRHNVPARCFAYVGDPNDVHTWKLPYLREDGSVDLRRLPMAISSIVRSYRGVKVDIPHHAMPGVLQRLAEAAKRIGKLPALGVAAAPVYRDLAAVLEQQGPTIDGRASTDREGSA